jgi:hypothetical protein
MIDFLSVRLSDAQVSSVAVAADLVEVGYVDWRDKRHSLVFRRAIACFVASPFGRSLSHGTIESDGEYLEMCCASSEEEDCAPFKVFNFVDAWGDKAILRVVAESVEMGSVADVT